MAGFIPFVIAVVLSFGPAYLYLKSIRNSEETDKEPWSALRTTFVWGAVSGVFYSMIFNTAGGALAFIYSGNSEDFRFYFEALGSRTISLDEINNKTKRVKQFLLNNPTEAFSPKQVSVACELNNANWAGNILAQLNGRGEIKRINATTLTTGGRRPYLYKAK